jgi:diketogulonate reductase-like aldo/keto reductase
MVYNTEAEVGAAIKESLDEGIIHSRDELFITTKILTDILNAPKWIDVSLTKLGVEYVDLYLLHSPYIASSSSSSTSDNDLQKAWSVMESVLATGKTRSIGVSNFEPEHLKSILKTAKIPPAINQIEFHPYFSSRRRRREGEEEEEENYLSALRQDNTIAISAYGALAPLTKNIASPVPDPAPLDEKLTAIAAKYDVTPALVCLRWCIDQDVVVVTTSRREERMKEYLRVFNDDDDDDDDDGFRLTETEVAEIGDAAMACFDENQEEPISRSMRYFRKLEEERMKREEGGH